MLKTLEVDLTPEDFVKISEKPAGPGPFFAFTGPNFGFMPKIQTLIDSCTCRSKGPVNIGFYNQDGELWGDPHDSFTASSEEFFQKGAWGGAFLMKRLWTFQQAASARVLGFPVGGFFFFHSDALREKYGTPVKFRATFEPYLSLVENSHP